MTSGSSIALRQAFLQFFRGHGHEVLRSGPLVPSNDPTLMFANAGMVQFKDVFTGRESRPYKRATTSQKCIRISGKHNDLENVGVTARHHTFFEMLGNFSFGDYFKEKAIEYAWSFITQTLAIPAERLVVTVFGGEAGVPADEEAATIWARVSGLPPERILRCGMADNFWQMGETGPCGPCSEIHYFLGDGPADPRSFGQEPTPEGLGWFELWNLVFMQFERNAQGEFKPLPAPSIDTGAGLERLAVVMQGVTSNYDTDLLRPIVDLAADISGKTYRASQSHDDIAMRVIADHARAAAFLMAEGVFPDREGRSYVLRRVMRRAIRHGHQLGIGETFLHRCTGRVVDIMGEAYPELREHRSLIEEVTRQEEERFRQTLKRGLELLANNEEWQRGEGGKRLLPGAVAFRLYDTYGFPLDLQEVIGREQGFGLDQEGFDAAMAEAREKSAGSKVGDRAVADLYHVLLRESGSVEFVGYEAEEATGSIRALVRGGQQVESLDEGQEGEIVADRTAFYAESGGQMGDRGVIRGPEGEFEVLDTQRPLEGLVIHHGRMRKGRIQKGDAAVLHVDVARREDTRRNHSATHLLHYALRQVLGAQAAQKGSLVGPDRLRFDFSSSRALTPEELRRIERIVNDLILANTPVETEVLGIDEAKARGAIGIFEEKYGERVRMLRIGPSLELCGGVHARRTGDIGLFLLLSEGGLAAGVRRIEALTGRRAYEQSRQWSDELQRCASLLKTSPAQLHERIEASIELQRELQREKEQLRRKLLSGGQSNLDAQVVEHEGAKLLGAVVDLDDVKALREFADGLRAKFDPGVVLLGARSSEGKAILVCAVSASLTSRWKAGDVVKRAAEVLGGRGGGRADFAQAGAPDASRLEEAVRSLYANVAAS